MEINQITFNPFQENTFILWDETKECIIIDPGCYEKNEKEYLSNFIESINLKPVKLINTHCHIDHILGNKFVSEKWKIDLYMNKKDLPLLEGAGDIAKIYGFENYKGSPYPKHFLEEGDVLEFGNSEYIKCFAFIIGLDAVTAISFAKLREMNNASRFALIRLVNIFVNIGLNLFFIVYCPYAIKNGLSSVEFVNSVYSEEIGIGYIFIANLIASIITFLMLLPEMIKSVWIFDKILWKNMMIYALPLLIAGLAGMTNETIDRILLKYLLPETVNASVELGLYGAFYKLSILMILFIQTFRFAAEPFFFAQEKEKNSQKVYADVMKYFVIITSLIFLVVTMFYEFIILFLGENYHDERGFKVVSILLAANLFLGIYYNLSIWYKLSEKTKYGAYLSIFGAIITLALNFILIPIIGFVGSAWATLACYFSMTVASYFLGKIHYSIKYPLKRIFFYLGLVVSMYFTSNYLDSNKIDVLYIIIFISIAFYLEKPKKDVISNPELFD